MSNGFKFSSLIRVNPRSSAAEFDEGKLAADGRGLTLI